ncbi:MAG: hypothetical protein Q7J25_10865 [Vicinamibacterales bacterium]|nr:hypothetical protein [Vicinamibacterales bacterium]
MLVKVLVAGFAGLLMGSLMHAAALVVLLVIWTQLEESEGPPVLKLAMTSQWMQVSVGLFYSRLTGQTFDVMDVRGYETTIYMGLGCVLALTAGLIAGIRAVNARLSDPGERATELATFNLVVVVYASSLVVTSVLMELSFQMPAIRQVLTVISLGRLAIVALLMRRLMHPEPQWTWALALLAFEVALGFTGYFSGFKEPVLIFALLLMETFDRRRVGHWLALGTTGAALLVALTMWMGVRDEYRRDFDDTLYAESRSVRFDRMQALFTDWLDGRNTKRGTDLFSLVDRFWVVYYPALAVDRVPRIQPHTGGALMGAALLHSVTPRFLFPDKAELINDSELVRKYSGVWVAGSEEGTSIAFGYAAEGYLDFGIPLMFIPVLAFGLALGAAYASLLRLIHHRELAIALVLCVFWYNLYQFERAWAKLIGGSVAMLIYLGGISYLIDRYLLSERGKQTQNLMGTPAYRER